MEELRREPPCNAGQKVERGKAAALLFCFVFPFFTFENYFIQGPSPLDRTVHHCSSHHI